MRKLAGMALPSILHHFELALANVDRGVERSLSMKVARHPSESMERVWLRVLALCWQWQEGIEFGPGLSDAEAPDVLARRPDGTAELIVRVGRPLVERVAKDVRQGGGARVAVLFDGPRRMEGFLEEAAKLRSAPFSAVELGALDPPFLKDLARQEERRVKGEVTLVGDHLYLGLRGTSLDGPLHRGVVEQGSGRG